MRTRILPLIPTHVASDDPNWLDLHGLADVEVTSEDPAHPIDTALLPNRTSEWRAGELGEQRIRLLFSSPQRVHRTQLNFVEAETDFVVSC